MNAPLKHNAIEEQLLAMDGDADALAQLREHGLPTRRVEAWHYTDLRSLLKHLPVKAGAPDAPKIDALLASYQRLTNSIRLPFLDGSFLKANKDDMPAGVSITHSPDAAGKPASNDDTIGMFDAVMGSSGVTVNVAAGTEIERSIGLAQVIGEAVYAGTRHTVDIGAKANVSIIERHLSSPRLACQANAIVDLSVSEGADVLWAVVQEHGDASTHLGQLNVSLAKDAKLTILMLNCGGKLVRQEVNVDSNGENCHLEILGVNLVGDGAHVDVTTRLSHNVAHTTAEETFRNVVTGKGRGVFQGQIKVAQPAQKTDAQMACNTLLLSDDSDFSAKPELEIFADDVVCAHGATVTDIDDEHLFYLRARGIAEADARALLVKAFVDEIFDDLDDETFKEALVGRIDDWLDRNG